MKRMIILALVLILLLGCSSVNRQNVDKKAILFTENDCEPIIEEQLPNPFPCQAVEGDIYIDEVIVWKDGTRVNLEEGMGFYSEYEDWNYRVEVEGGEDKFIIKPHITEKEGICEVQNYRVLACERVLS